MFPKSDRELSWLFTVDLSNIHSPEERVELLITLLLKACPFVASFICMFHWFVSELIRVMNATIVSSGETAMSVTTAKSGSNLY